MKNANYNAIKLLHLTLDNLWHIEQHYLNDAEGLSCKCGELLSELQTDLQKHVELLKGELGEHLKADDLA